MLCRPGVALDSERSCQLFSLPLRWHLTKPQLAEGSVQLCRGTAVLPQTGAAAAPQQRGWREVSDLSPVSGTL